MPYTSILKGAIIYSDTYSKLFLTIFYATAERLVYQT